ncbi:MAG: O-antigen ligase family protein [Asticcacaulis sp.]
MKDFIEDWRDEWPSLVLGALILIGFSQGWECPIFGYSTAQSTQDSGLIRAFYYPVYACGIALSILAWRRLADATWRTVLLLLLVGLTLASALWSIDPDTTIRRFIALLATTLCAYAMASRFGWRRLSEVIALSFVVLMVASYGMAILLPRLGRMTELFPGAWRGVWVEKNNLGSTMAIGFVACAAAALHNMSRWRWWAGAAVLMLALVILSTSKTSLVSIAVGTAAMFAIWLARRGPLTAVAVVWLGVSAMLMMAAVILIDPALLFSLLGKDATFTGRTFIWDGIMRQIRTRPYTGFGYGAVWSNEGRWTPLAKIVAIAGFRPYHAHSSWLEVWLGMGLGGLILWACVVLEAWLKALWRAFRGDGGYFALPFLAIFTLSSLTESLALVWNDMRWCLLVLVIVKVSLRDDSDSVIVPKALDDNVIRYVKPNRRPVLRGG